MFIRFFGNAVINKVQIPNNLAVLLRTRRIRDIEKRTDWNTPGGWRVDKHPRLLADLTGDGRADIVGFGDAGVWTALSNVDGTFADPQFVLADFGFEAGGWRVEKHPRFLADLTRRRPVGHRRASATPASTSRSARATARSVARSSCVADFGFEAGGWRVDKHPRFVADLTGDGRADIVGFGDGGV